MRDRSSAFSLASVLLCLAVLVSVIFIAVSASLSHLNVMNSVGQRQHAQNLAESALSQAMERIIATDFAFGNAPTDRVQVSIDGLDDAEGIVSFNRTEFPAGYSTSNFRSTTNAVGVRNTNIPPSAVHLVARGRVGDTERWMECVFYKPPFPDGLVASGSVEASGLLLTGVKEGEDYAGGDPEDVNPEDKVLANLFANGRGASRGSATVVLGDDCEIHGSVGSPGQIEVAPDSVVEGEVLPGSEPRALPSIDISERIEKLIPNSVPVLSGGDLTLDDSWFNHSAGSLTVGNLDLNGSALTVRGDLIVNGAITGTGVILVDGWVEVRDGGSAVVSTDQVALAATGDVSLSASAKEANYFQGLVYSEGNVEASDITVVGTVVTRGQGGKAGDVKLENVRFVKTPASVEVNLSAQQGFGFGGRSTAVSVTLTRAPDGETYLADVRVAHSRDGDIDNGPATYLHLPIEWDRFGDTPRYRTWSGVNVGKPGPNMGRALASEIADWAGKKSKWEPRYQQILTTTMNGLLDAREDEFELSFGLNNLLSEQFGHNRVLLWRPFER